MFSLRVAFVVVLGVVLGGVVSSGFVFSAVSAASSPAQCRIMNEEIVGPAQSIAVTKSGGRFMVAGSDDGGYFVQTYDAKSAKRLVAKRSAVPFIPLKQVSGFSLVLGVRDGYVLSGSQWDAVKGNVPWIAAFDRNFRYLGMFGKNTKERSVFKPSGGIRIGAEGLAVSENCVPRVDTVRYSVASLNIWSRGHLKPVASFEMNNSRCGGIGGAAELGKAVGVVVQRFSPDNTAYLTFAVRSTPTTAWQYFNVTDPLPNAERLSNYFIIWNFFAEADRFTVAWLNKQVQANELRSYNAQGEVVNSLVLPADVTDIQPVAGGYLVSTYDFSTQQAGVSLISRTGDHVFDLPIQTTLAARLPLITWNEATHSALYAWIDESQDGRRQLFTRIISCD